MHHDQSMPDEDNVYSIDPVAVYALYDSMTSLVAAVGNLKAKVCRIGGIAGQFDAMEVRCDSFGERVSRLSSSLEETTQRRSVDMLCQDTLLTILNPHSYYTTEAHTAAVSFMDEAGLFTGSHLRLLPSDLRGSLWTLVHAGTVKPACLAVIEEYFAMAFPGWTAM